MLDLFDGSRLHACVTPTAVDGDIDHYPEVPQRQSLWIPLLRMVRSQRNWLEFLRACVAARQSIVISGGTGSGKTTLINAVWGHLSPYDESIVTIEDTAGTANTTPRCEKNGSQNRKYRRTRPNHIKESGW